MTDTANKTDYIVATDAAPIAVDVVVTLATRAPLCLCGVMARTCRWRSRCRACAACTARFRGNCSPRAQACAAVLGKLERDEHVIERDGVERFVGRLAVEHIAAASSGRGSDARYHDGTTLDFILAGIAAALPGPARSRRGLPRCCRFRSGISRPRRLTPCAANTLHLQRARDGGHDRQRCR